MTSMIGICQLAERAVGHLTYTYHGCHLFLLSLVPYFYVCEIQALMLC